MTDPATPPQAPPAAAPDATAPPRPPSRWARRLGWSMAVVLVLAGALAAAFAHLPDWLRPRLEAAAQDVLGTPVQLGRIDLQPLALGVQVQDVRIGPADAPLFQLAQLQVELSPESITRRAPVVRRLTLQAPQVWVRRDAAGRFDFEPVLAHIRDWRAAHPPGPEPARYALHNLRLVDGTVRYADAQLGEQHEVSALQIDLPFLSNLPSDVQTEVLPRLQATVDGSDLRLEAQARPFAPQQTAALTLRWQQLDLARGAALLKAALPPDLALDLSRGRLDADLTLAFDRPAADQPPRLHIGGDLAVRELQARLPGARATVAWQALTLSGLDLAPLQQRYRLADVTLQGLDADATWPPADPAATPAAPPAAPAMSPTDGSSPGTAASAPDWRIERVRCQDCRARLRDARLSPGTELTLSQTQLSAAPVSGDLGQALQIELQTALTTRTGPGGTAPATPPGQIDIRGALRPAPLSLQAELTLAALDLQAAQPYLAPYLNLVLNGGRLGTAGRLNLAQSTAGLTADYRGRLSVDALRTRDSVTGAEFVGWQQLAFDDLAVALQPAGQVSADLGRIRLDGLQARVILHPDGHLNLADIVRPASQVEPRSLTTPQPARAASDAQADRTAKPVASAASAASTVPDVRWREVLVQRGTVQFSDAFIQPNYSARLTQLQGRVSALSARAPEPAQVDIGGALDDGAPLRISGRVHPLGARLFTDLEASARGIVLTRLSAYAERYAGYAIDQGSMSVNLRYRIDQGRLQAENQLFLDQLTFGDAVASPDATKLPVRLAVALLKNSKGEIDLRLPVAGTLDDPQFSVGGLVWKLVLNLVERAVTAPFSLLMGGEGGEAPSQIDFAPGEAVPGAAALAQLDTLARRLLDRPGLKLEVTAEADPVLDGAALRPAPPAPPAAPAAPATAASAAAPATPAAAAPAAAFDLPTALRTLADRRADVVMAHLSATLPAERVLINRSVVTGSGTVQDRGPSPRVQFTLR